MCNKCKKCKKMEFKQLKNTMIDENLSFKKQKKSDPIQSKKELYSVLRIWAVLNKKDLQKTIGEKSYGGQPILWIKIDGELYYLNADSKMEGIIEFIKNENYDWQIIANNRGKLNKITNHPESKSINGLYLYKTL